MVEEVSRYTDLLTKVIARLAKIWEMREGDLHIEVRTDEQRTFAKISGGETERVK